MSDTTILFEGTIRFEGVAETMAKLNAVSDAAAGSALRAGAQAGALVIQTLARTKAPVKSGDLRRSIQIDIQNGMRSVTAKVGTNLVYAPMVEYGGTIVPKTARFLMFEVDGRKVFARKVVQRARPFMRPAFDEGKAEAIKAMEHAIGDVLGRAG